ncbi:MAG TPA: cytochrome c biogenesis protein ResB [Terriglobales bacterium]|nr:cytochrome c biogenesis protein ResB [Terriglobales bacterium]
MALTIRDCKRSFWQTMGSIRTGIVLLILIGIATFAGTIIMQRPINDANKLHHAYSPATLRWLDALGLTDVFHSWWFAVLLALLSANIVVASLDRWPVVWRYFSRPYRRAEPHFLASLSMQHEFRIRDEAAGIEAAAAAFRSAGLTPQHVVKDTVSLYAEKFRFARLAPFVVHASLLLIFAGVMIDGVFGYRGYISLVPGEAGGQIEMRDGTRKVLPFALRCDSTGQENYPDGSPKRWWSKLAVVENNRQVRAKEISVNDPLDYRGVRFFQAGYGPTGELQAVKLTATPKGGGPAQALELAPDKLVRLDAATTVRLAQFIPDFAINGNQITTRSQQPNNPALHLVVTTAKGDADAWLFPRVPDFNRNGSEFDFAVTELVPQFYTGLEVSYEPGQWGVWAGVLLMGVALALVFYFVHIRFWAVPVDDGRGRLVLWVGASASKNRDEVEERFNRLVATIEQNLQGSANTPAREGESRAPVAMSR